MIILTMCHDNTFEEIAPCEYKHIRLTDGENYTEKELRIFKEVMPHLISEESARLFSLNWKDV